MSILQTLALSSAFAKIPLAGLGAATAGGLVTYLLIVPNDNKKEYIIQTEKLESELKTKEAELEDNEKKAGAKFTELLNTWEENIKHKKEQDCKRERIDTYKRGKSDKYAHELLSGCH